MSLRDRIRDDVALALVLCCALGLGAAVLAAVLCVAGAW